MTTPDQLLADAKWRRQHSIYTLWALFIGFGFISLFYTGIRSKKNNWTTWGVVYAVLVIGVLSIVGAVSPRDPEASTPVAGNVATAVFLVLWVVSAIHVFRVRQEWLRWKAAAAGRPQWYDAPLPSVNQPAAADLTSIGIDDPTTDYLAPPSPASVMPSFPPPAAPALSGPLPPTETNSPSRSAGRPIPPPPSAPSLAAAKTSPEPIDLNTATVDDIASLPGVGVATAHRIVEERNRRGGFESVEEAAMAAKLQPHVRARLQHAAVVSERQQPTRRGTAGRIVDF